MEEDEEQQESEEQEEELQEEAEEEREESLDNVLEHVESDIDFSSGEIDLTLSSGMDQQISGNLVQAFDAEKVGGLEDIEGEQREGDEEIGDEQTIYEQMEERENYGNVQGQENEIVTPRTALEPERVMPTTLGRGAEIGRRVGMIRGEAMPTGGNEEYEVVDVQRAEQKQEMPWESQSKGIAKEKAYYNKQAT